MAFAAASSTIGVSTTYGIYVNKCANELLVGVRADRCDAVAARRFLITRRASLQQTLVETMAKSEFDLRW